MLKITTRHEKDIVLDLNSDLGKHEHEAFLHEISAVSAACRMALKELHLWLKPEKVKTSMTTFPSSGELVPEPYGVVLVISTWNYPILLSLEPFIAAISAGSAVVLKPSEVAPATSEAMAKLLGKYMDMPRLSNWLFLEMEVSVYLYLNKFSTGNNKVGRIILAAAAQHLTPVILELGGKCPVIVDSNINLKVAVKRLVSGKWGCNSGQTCVAPDYVITTKAFASKLVDAISSELERFYGKDPVNSTDMSRIINSRHFERLTKLLDEDKLFGKIVIGGQRDKTNLKIAPTAILDPPLDSLIMTEEIFGPLLPIIMVKDIRDGINLITSKEKPFAAYIFTNDRKLKENFMQRVSAGGIAVNEVTINPKKPVLYRDFNGDISARYPPYTTRKMKFLKAAMSGSIIGIIRALLGCSSSSLLLCQLIRELDGNVDEQVPSCPVLVLAWHALPLTGFT
ncbi:hypothetical protein SASPL_148141 [Salvia splendens]|uniref:Aldehyde dehydrogenase n=1 Tax=Salvia splendens TaxID=180675 RepID=A0A8X8Z435_SALSN|nr:hypothetical protein SASPL_148141 [Salvia splendens]